MASEECSGTITVTGPSYKATITIIQSGADQIVSMVRNKKKMTVTCKLGSAEFHCFRVYRYKVDEYGNWNNGTRIKAGIIKGNKITFDVAKGYAYDVEIGPAQVQAEWSVYLQWEWCAYAQMVVTKLTGTQQADYIYNTVQ